MRLARAVQFLGGTGFPNDEQGGREGIPFLKVSDLQTVSIATAVEGGANYVTDEQIRRLRATVAPSGSVLMPKIGAAMRGSHRRVRIGLDAVFDNNIVALVPRSVDSRYLTYWLAQMPIEPLIQPGAVASLDMTALKAVQLPNVDTSEQARIADFLDYECLRIEELERELSASMSLAEEWLTARTAELLAVGTGAVPFGRYATLHRGFDLPSQDRKAGVVEVIGSGGVTGLHDVAAVPAPAVITGRYGSIGVVTWSEVPCWPLNTTLFVSDFKGNVPRFIYWALRSLPLKQEASKSAVPGLHRAEVHRLRLGDFSHDEQAGIAESLDRRARELQGLRDELQRQLVLLREYRDALITEAVHGEFNLRRVSGTQMEERIAAVREGESPEVLA